MNSSENLRSRLKKIDHRSYPAYKDLQGGYEFPFYQLFIDHVQGDPFAAPSKLHLFVPHKNSHFPKEYYGTIPRRIALQDYLTRLFHKNISSAARAKGSGKSGLLSVSRCGQEILERSACQITSDGILLRFEAGFPAAGRTVLSSELEKMLFQIVPDCARQSLIYSNLSDRELHSAITLADDQEYLRECLIKNHLAAFVANGSILPRESGASSRPMKNAIPFQSPKSLELTFSLPSGKKISGMGIPDGITLIAGGGYHGKSTLLKALELGVYNHIRGDGREYVITRNDAVKLRAEDGRAVLHTDISPFINHLPNNISTTDFSTEDASGSTSQAAAMTEAIESGSRLLLIDEDTSATNFMVRDFLMQAVISRDKEPITPFVERIRPLYEQNQVSTILVAGSSGSYFYCADTILEMNCYQIHDITEKVRNICREYPSGKIIPTTYHAPSFNRHICAGKVEHKHGEIKTKCFGTDSFSIAHTTVDLKFVEQLIDPEQIQALAFYTKRLIHLLEKPAFQKMTVLELTEKLLSENIFEKHSSAAFVRKQDLLSCISRCRIFH